MTSWIVEPNVLGGWDVRGAASTEPVLRASTRETAEAGARACAGARDEVIVRDGQGRVLWRFAPTGPPSPEGRRGAVFPPGPSAAARPTASRTESGPAAQSEGTSPSLVQRVEKEGETWDQWLDVGIPVGAAVLVGGFTPAFLDLGTSWLAIFLGTLSWSAGVAGATYFIESHKLRGPDAVGAAGLCLLAALGLAYTLGTGVLDVEAQWLELGGQPWIRLVLAFAFAAVLAYGPLGAVLSAMIGVWLGHRIAQHFPGD